jgi:hypothetical protein
LNTNSQDGTFGNYERKGGQSATARRFALFAVLWSFPSSVGHPPPAAAQTAPKNAPQNLFPVKPVSSIPAQPPRGLGISNGQFFSYALPPDWRVAEDGQFALTLAGPGNKAITVMVGNAGVPVNYPPDRYVYEKLSAMQPANLQLGQPRQAAPIAGFSHAYQFDFTYTNRGGVPCRGIAKCHIYAAYDIAVLVMTAAFTEASLWPEYASWLPLVAEQISANNGAAFGRRGIMAQNLQNSMAYAEAARQYRDWSQKNWAQVTKDRNDSEDRKNFNRRENLGGVQTYANPFGTSAPPVEMPLTYKYYWTDNQGNYRGTNDPSANPNVGATHEWRQMPRYRP